MSEQKQKIDILLKALDERYKSIHIIRERVQTVSIWILGFLISGASWIYQSEINFYPVEFLAIFFAIICVWISLWRFYFRDLELGFNSQRKVAAKIEKSLGFYSEGYFLEGDEVLYPKDWENSGKRNGKGNFIRNNYILIAVGFALLVVSMITHTSCCTAKIDNIPLSKSTKSIIILNSEK